MYNTSLFVYVCSHDGSFLVQTNHVHQSNNILLLFSRASVQCVMFVGIKFSLGYTSALFTWRQRCALWRKSKDVTVRASTESAWWPRDAELFAHALSAGGRTDFIFGGGMIVPWTWAEGREETSTTERRKLNRMMAMCVAAVLLITNTRRERIQTEWDGSIKWCGHTRALGGHSSLRSCSSAVHSRFRNFGQI